MDVRENDWIATLLYNPDLSSLEELKGFGVVPSNTDLKPIEEYKKLQDVQEAFTDEKTGKFDENAFTQFYNNAKVAYNDYANNEFLVNAVINYEYSVDDWLAPLDAKRRNDSPVIKLDNRFRGDTNYTSGIGGLQSYILDTKQDMSVREIAQTQEVIDYKTGESLGWTPNEKGGLFKSLGRPTVVLAQYDEDGFHDEKWRSSCS